MINDFKWYNVIKLKSIENYQRRNRLPLPLWILTWLCSLLISSNMSNLDIKANISRTSELESMGKKCLQLYWMYSVSHDDNIEGKLRKSLNKLVIHYLVISDLGIAWQWVISSHKLTCSHSHASDQGLWKTTANRPGP